MKNIFKSTLLAGLAAFAMTSCTEEDNTIDQVFDGVSSGAVLRTIDVSSLELPIGVDDATFSVTVEEQDAEGGALLESVNVAVTFVDNSADAGDTSNGTVGTLVPITIIPASAFTDGPFGLPRTTITLTFPELLSAVNLTSEDLFGDDTFLISLTLNLTDGRSFDASNAAGVVTTGFFQSPFQYLNKVVCLVDNDDFFSGAYTMEETTGNADPFGGNYGVHYPASQPVVLAGSGTIRTFDYEIYPDFFQFGQTGTLTFNCGSVEFASTSTSGTLGCDGTNTIEDMHDTPQAMYDPNLEDDAVLEFPVIGFSNDGACGTGPYSIALKFSKQ
jgi:hypothetical protein